jgi:hypothetical protein
LEIIPFPLAASCAKQKLFDDGIVSLLCPDPDKIEIGLPKGRFMVCVCPGVPGNIICEFCAARDKTETSTQPLTPVIEK